MIYPFFKGFLTDEQRAEGIEYTTRDGSVFKARRDLSGGVRLLFVSTKTPNRMVNYDRVAMATAEFIGVWAATVYPHLNGFAGFDCVTITVIPN